MTITSLVSEVRAAEAAGDLPRCERAIFALRTHFGVSLGAPLATQHRYTPYRYRETAP
jgi:hypothetical protein